MSTRLVHVAIDAIDPARQARFWSAALGWEIAPPEPDEVDVWPTAYSYPDPVALPLVFVRVPAPKTVKNRIHLDIRPWPGEDPAAAVAELRVAGATPVDVGQGDVPWTVLADPEGSEFCVLPPL